MEKDIELATPTTERTFVLEELTLDDSSKSEATPTESKSKYSKFWAWASVFSAFFLQMTGFGYSTTFGVFQDFYVREYLTTSTSSQISWIGSTQSFLMLTMGLVTGPLFDRGYGYHLVAVGSVILVLSFFLLSLAQPEKYYQIFLTQGLGVGIGGSLTYVPSLAVLAQHFRSERSRAQAMGLAVAGVPFAGLVHPILLDSLLHRSGATPVEAFQKATRASAGFVTGLIVISLLLLRVKPEERNEGLTSRAAPLSNRAADYVRMIVRYASDWPYVCIVLGLSLFEVVFFFPIFYLQLYSIQKGLDPTFAFYSLSILNGASMFGRFFSGYLTRFLGLMNMFVVSTVMMTGVLFCMIAAHDVAGVSTFAIFYGLCSGTYITLMAPVLSLLAEHPSEIGSRLGLCFTVSGIGSLIGAPIAGALLTSKYIWWRPVVFSGAICTIGTSFFIMGHLLYRRRNLQKYNS